ncbi:MAG: 6-pyruvoyl-tetrahydropterin synthase-related protein [Patescibacteria group bacterium]|nr:6-pyruvoyl-tetrahydropterin synthase-related protein [Patescibacteria group bacterium]
MLKIIKKNKNLAFLVLVAFLTIPAAANLLRPGLPLTDDGNWMVIRFSAFYEALRNGQFPVRFLFRLNNGFGYPVADFLYPLFMYIGVPIHILGFSFVNTIKAILVLSLAFGSMFTFLWLRKLFDNLSSFTGAVFFTFFPYHIFDLYKRGSVGEILSISILPFILWQVERNSIFWSSIGIALIILSHNTLAFLFLLMVVLYFALNIFISKNRKKLLYKYTVTLAIGLGLSSFFWFPAAYDLRYTVFFKTQVSNWNSYFTDFGLVGLSSIFIIFLTFIFMVTGRIQIKKNNPTVLFLVVGLAAIFFSSSLSASFWSILPVSFIQFPFRLLSVAIICISFLSAFVVSVLSGKKKIIMVIIIFALGVFSAAPYFTVSKYQYFPDSFYSTNQDTTTVKNEYMPVWVKKIPESMANGKVTVIKGHEAVDNLFTNGNKTNLSLYASEASIIQYNTIYFPGWKVLVDGKDTPISFDNDGGLIRFNVDKGKHAINIYFTETPLRIFSDFISIISFIALFGLVIKDRSLLRK